MYQTIMEWVKTINLHYHNQLERCVSINGILFTGSLTFNEMRTKIPRNGLEIDPENFHSVRYSFEGCPVVKLILKTKLDIELISHKKNFEITRNSESSQGYEVNVSIQNISNSWLASDLQSSFGMVLIN